MRQIDGNTQLIGLIGSNIGFSKSFIMHNTALFTLNINAVYIPMKVTHNNLRSALSGLCSLHFLGANITMPFKKQALQSLDRITATAQKIGAVNTILYSEGKLTGDNTDAQGFMASLRENDVQILNRPIYIYGTGGSARAIAYALAESGSTQFYFFSRRKKPFIAISTMLHNCFDRINVQEFDRVSDNDAIIINCTPVGLTPSETLQQSMLWPVEDTFASTQTVIDLIYEPTETPLLRKAQEEGAQTINGLGMLVHQAANSFAWWTQCSPPINIMKQSLLQEPS